MNRIKQALFTSLFFKAQYTTPFGRLNISNIVRYCRYLTQHFEIQGVLCLSEFHWPKIAVMKELVQNSISQIEVANANAKFD